MATIKSFEDLEIWKESMDLAVEVYHLFDNPKLVREYSLKDQSLRASISISNNIAEGFEYNNNTQFLRFLSYAKGSCGETRNMLLFLSKVNLVDSDKSVELIEKTKSISSKTGKLMSYLKTKSTQATK